MSAILEAKEAARRKVNDAIRDTLETRPDLTFEQIAEMHGVSISHITAVRREYAVAPRKRGRRPAETKVTE